MALLQKTLWSHRWTWPHICGCWIYGCFHLFRKLCLGQGQHSSPVGWARTRNSFPFYAIWVPKIIQYMFSKFNLLMSYGQAGPGWKDNHKTSKKRSEASKNFSCHAISSSQQNHEELNPTNSLHNQLLVLQQHHHISNSSVSKMQVSVTLSYLDEKIFHLGVLA